MSACIFCKGRRKVHNNGCPFITPTDEKGTSLTDAEYELFASRADEWLDEEDPSKPDLTVTLTRASMIGMQKIMRDMILPPPGKDSAMIGLRSYAELLTRGEKFLTDLQEALTKTTKSRVQFDGDDDDDSAEDEGDTVPQIPEKPAPKRRLIAGK